MLTADAMKLLKPDENMMTVSIQDGLVIVQTGKNWFAMTRNQTIEFIQRLANAANSLV